MATAFLFFLSLFFATPSSSPFRSHLIFIGFLKFLIRRSRPSYSVHNDYNGVVAVDNFSFPSGHSSRVCFIASIFSHSRTLVVDAVADANHPWLAMLVHRSIGGDKDMAVNLLVTAIWSWALTIVIFRVVLGRQASMARKIYLRRGLGVGAFQRIYGGSQRNGSRPPHFCKSSGAIA